MSQGEWQNESDLSWQELLVLALRLESRQHLRIKVNNARTATEFKGPPQALGKSISGVKQQQVSCSQSCGARRVRPSVGQVAEL